MNAKVPCCLGLTTITFLYAAVAQGAAMPMPFEADYAGSKFPFTATARIELARVGDYYKYMMHSTVYMGLYQWDEAYDCSVIRVSGEALYPLKYVHQDKRDGDGKTQTRFDWDKRIVHTSAGDGTVQEHNGLQYPAWDVMSIQVGLIRDVAAADRYTKLEYAIVDKDKVTHHRGKIEGEGVIVVNKKSLRAVKVSVDGPKGANMFIFWFAEDYAWLPVRVSIGGVTLDLASAPAHARRKIAPPGAGMPDC